MTKLSWIHLGAAATFLFALVPTVQGVQSAQGVAVQPQDTTGNTQPPCTVHPTAFHGWPAQQMSNAWVDLVFVPELGGRLMQVTFAGHPYLFVNPQLEGKFIPSEKTAGQWINYGGDKIWPLPEGNEDEQHWTGASTPLDDSPYEFKIIAQGQHCTVRLDGPPDPPTGLQYSREISIGTDSPAIAFHAITKNYTGHSIAWSVQSVSQYNLSSTSGANGYNHNFWAYTPVNASSGYLLGYHVRDGLANDPSFSVKDGLFRLNWKYIESEVWIDSTAGWVAVIDGESNFTMIEKSKYVKSGEYPSKASVIFYKNGPTVELDASGMPHLSRIDRKETPYYMEAELNSPMVELAPGETYTFDTNWFPCRMGPDLQGVTEAGVVGQPLVVIRNGKELALNGKFGVYLAGDLEAHLYDRGGAEQAVVNLGAVSPKESISLIKSIPAKESTARVSLHLVDPNHVDHGPLGEVMVTESKGKP